jgi:uncharacterized membrane protein
MEYKNRFLEDLRQELKAQKVASDDVVEYYDELIEERVAAGEDEQLVVKSLGSAAEVAKNTHADQQISAAIEKPTLSNGSKALLGALSLPLALPLAIAVVVLAFAYLIVLAALIVAAVAVGVAAVAAALKVMVSILTGGAPFYLLFLAVGMALILVPLSYGAIRGLIFATGKLVSNFADMLRKKQSKKGSSK